ncbi:MAG: hypothetical protein GY927_08135 [bacterium]|nr:hypothetical protein [bacterium]
MTTYQPYIEFPAQSRATSALGLIYAQLERETLPKDMLLPLVVFLAFSIEAYLNSIGSKQLSIWDELERLPWKKKIIVLHKIAEKPCDFGRDPLQFAAEVFTIRVKLAHGKPEKVFGPIFDKEQDAHNYLCNINMEPDWYIKITPGWAIIAKNRHRLLMTYLGNLYDLHESDHLVHSTGGIITDDQKNESP